MCITYLFFYRALKAQGIDRNTLPYKGWVSLTSIIPYSHFPQLPLNPVVLHHPSNTPNPPPKSHLTPNQTLTPNRANPT